MHHSCLTHPVSYLEVILKTYRKASRQERSDLSGSEEVRTKQEGLFWSDSDLGQASLP